MLPEEDPIPQPSATFRSASRKWMNFVSGQGIKRKWTSGKKKEDYMASTSRTEKKNYSGSTKDEPFSIVLFCNDIKQT